MAGTRPEAIKLAPVARLLKSDRRFRLRLIATGQHRALALEALAAFGLEPDALLRASSRPTLDDLLASVVAGMNGELSRRAPDAVLVQGDTTSALGAALSAFHHRIPVAHLEAGLRTGDLSSPFPEEMNRIVIDRIASVWLAPTPRAARALRAEGASPRSLYVTGNTAVDALFDILARPAVPPPRAFKEWTGRPVAVVTLHRRENLGPAFQGLVSALRRAAARRPEILWIIPAHPNPEASAPLAALPRRRFRIVPPIDYPTFVRLLSRCAFAATDSGGVQEEAPTLGLRYLVLRRVTERPEALGRWGTLVGTEPRAVEQALVRAASQPRLSPGVNPFGDGLAARRVADALLHWASRGPRPADFQK